MSLPPWMLDRSRRDASCQASAEAPVPAAEHGRGRPVVCDGTQLAPCVNERTPRRNLVRRAIESFARLIDELMANDTIAAQPGLLQQIDPRAKVIGIIGLIVIVTLVHRFSTLLLAYALCLLLAMLSRVPARRLTHAWLVIPLFSAAIMLPAILNIVTPGQPLLILWHFSGTHVGPWKVPPTLTITDAGVYVAGRFILRTAVCVTLALLLTVTTRANRLFCGLRALGVPMLFVTLLSMMERYLTVFVRAAEEIHLAKVSRSITLGTVRQEQAWVAAGMGALFRRTQSLGHAVYLAMLSRGYTGEIYTVDDPRWKDTDWAFIMIAAGFAVVMLIVG